MEPKQESTENLMNILQKTSPSEVKTYLQQHLKDSEPYFPRYIDELLAEKNMKRQDVILRANFPQKYGYKLLTGETHTTDRDKILRICFAMEMTLQETQRTLKMYGMNELYPKVKRDVHLILALGQKMYDLDKLNDWLTEQDEEPLYRLDEIT